jgi:hypothetical protein
MGYDNEQFNKFKNEIKPMAIVDTSYYKIPTSITPSGATTGAHLLSRDE